MRLEAGVTGGASISTCGTWRYSLTRAWSATQLDLGPVLKPRGLCAWVMLNPSTADGVDVDDRTVRKCQAFARRWGFSGIAVLNLFGLRSTLPRSLYEHEDPVGPDNDATIVDWLARPDLERVVEAWGNHGPLLGRAGIVHEMVRASGREVVRLATTKTGQPGHPLYLRLASPPMADKVRSAAGRTGSAGAADHGR